MEEIKEEVTEVKETKPKKEKFKAFCRKCYSFTDVAKTKDFMKECKDYANESEEKYGNRRVIKRALYHGCSICGKTINVCCSDYVDFYSPKKKVEEKIENENKGEM